MPNYSLHHKGETQPNSSHKARTRSAQGRPLCVEACSLFILVPCAQALCGVAVAMTMLINLEGPCPAPCPNTNVNIRI